MWWELLRSTSSAAFKGPRISIGPTQITDSSPELHLQNTFAKQSDVSMGVMPGGEGHINVCLTNSIPQL